MKNMDMFGDVFKQVFNRDIKIVYIKTSQGNWIWNKSALEVLFRKIGSTKARGKVRQWIVQCKKYIWKCWGC